MIHEFILPTVVEMENALHRWHSGISLEIADLDKPIMSMQDQKMWLETKLQLMVKERAQKEYDRKKILLRIKNIKQKSTPTSTPSKSTLSKVSPLTPLKTPEMPKLSPPSDEPPLAELLKYKLHPMSLFFKKAKCDSDPDFGFDNDDLDELLLDVDTKDDPKQEASDRNDLDDMATFTPNKKTNAVSLNRTRKLSRLLTKLMGIIWWMSKRQMTTTWLGNDLKPKWLTKC